MIIQYMTENGIIKITQNPEDFYCHDAIKLAYCKSALDLMNNCLDTIYQTVHSHYPTAFRPDIYLSDGSEENAFTDGSRIIVYSGLIFNSVALLNQRYSPEVIDRYNAFCGINRSTVLSKIRVYLWRFIVLHELYHIWNGHLLWLNSYFFDEEGSVISKAKRFDVQYERDEHLLSELVCEAISELSISKQEEQNNITLQAIELDADSSAFCMLINLLMQDVEARKINAENVIQYVTTEAGAIMGALATAFCLFDGNHGAKFEVLSCLTNMDHPIPALRFAYAEEIIDGMLSRYFPSERDLRSVESEWTTLICDVEADYDGRVDMGQVFFFTAHTEKAQKHLSLLKRRLNDMYDSLQPFVLANRAPKMEEDQMSFLPEAVWFDERGKSLRGWSNPSIK